MVKNKSIFITVLLTFVVSFILTKHYSWEGIDGKGYTRIIESDGKGYYLYLPSIFINNNIEEQTPDERFVFKTENGSVNKYYVGTAVAMFPFFVSGYITANLCNEPLDGYSTPFQKAISFAGLFYLCLGMLFLSGLLQLYEVRTSIICITLIAIVFGTNLLMYALYHPSFSHIYSFCFISIFLFYSKKFTISKQIKYAIFFTASLGMILLIRPSNGIVIFLLPFIAGSFSSLKEMFSTLIKTKTLLILSCMLLSFLSLQLYLWYLQTGDFFLWSYQNEGFYFLHPQFFNVLFSFRKGLFLYTPLLLLSLAGLILLFKKNKFEFYSLSIFLCLLVYITSSWWCWYYGPSFGQRSFIDFYSVNAFLIGIFLSSVLKSNQKIVVFSIVTILCVFNLLQSYQYVNGILSSWDMNYEKYKYVFLKTSDDYRSSLGGCRDIEPYSKTKNLLLNQSNDYEKKYPNWNESVVKKLENEHTNVCDYTSKEFNTSFEFKADEATANYRLLYAILELERIETIPSGKSGPLIVITLSNSQNEIYHYYSFPLNEIPNQNPMEWKTIKYTIEIPKIRSADDHLKIYVWNQHLQAFYLDNVHFLLFGIN